MTETTETFECVVRPSGKPLRVTARFEKCERCTDIHLTAVQLCDLNPKAVGDRVTEKLGEQLGRRATIVDLLMRFRQVAHIVGAVYDEALDSKAPTRQRDALWTVRPNNEATDEEMDAIVEVLGELEFMLKPLGEA